MVPRWMGIGLVWPKWSPLSMVLEWEYILPISATESWGKPRSLIMASRRAWSMDPNAFLKSMYRKYISRWLICVSSSAAVRVWICLEVHLSARNPSWLSCRIWYLSPYVDNMDVRVSLVKSL